MKIRAVVVTLLIAAAASSAQAWTIEKWTESDLSAEDAIRWKMMAVAQIFQDVELFAQVTGANQVRARDVVHWLRDLSVADQALTDWAAAHERLRRDLGEERAQRLLERVRLRGGRAYPPSGRAPSDYAVSTLTWAWHHPAQDVTRVKVVGGIAVSAAPNAQVHGAIRVEREHYGEPECGDWYNGTMPACTTFASAFNGMIESRSCNAAFVDEDCGDGNVSTLVARLTFIETDSNGNVIERLLDDFTTSECVASSCDCGLGDEPLL